MFTRLTACLVVAILASGAKASGPPSPGHAVSFNGGLITIPDGPALSLGNRATVECWIRPLSTSANQRFIEQGDGWGCESDRAFDMALNPAYFPGSGHLTGWAFYRPGCTATEAPGAWTLGQWTHVAMTIDITSNTHRLYVNGTLRNESTGHIAASFGPSIGDSTRRLVLGGAGDWPGHNYTGEMDELRIWNVVRSPSEIQGSMSQSLPPATPGLVAYFKFDEGGGTATQDATGNLASGALGAGVSWVSVSGASLLEAVQWTAADGGNGHWYAVVTKGQQITWQQASAEAVGRGGHLATLSSQIENQWVFARTLQVPGAWNNNVTLGWNYGPWLGARRQPLGSSTWAWVTSEPFSFASWYPAQPDSAGQNWLAFGVGVNQTPGPVWADTFDDEDVRSFIIEWDADCNNDGVVDYGQIRAGALPDVNNNGVPDGCESPVPGAVQWAASEGGNGHWYQGYRSPTPIEWPSAKVQAEALGGHLATITSSSEQNFITAFAAGRPELWQNEYGGPWIGGYQDRSSASFSEPAGGWRWVTSEPWQYTNWDPGEPNNQNGVPEDYLHIVRLSTGAWGDFPDISSGWVRTGTYAYIVEWSADCNNDGIVDYGQIRAGSLPDVNNNGVPDGCDPAPCNLADIASVGSTPPLAFHDGQLTVDDIIVFVNLYGDGSGCPGASPCSQADVCGIGGPPAPPDGQLTVDDIIAFVNAFGDGC